MSHRVSRTMIAALLFAAITSTIAVAADRFGVIGVENGTKVVIRMQHRWGNGEWQSDVLGPGQRKWFWWEFKRANENQTPRFHVKFDSDLSPGHFWENYDLKAYQAPDHEWVNAHKYIFKYDGNARKFIELYDEKR